MTIKLNQPKEIVVREPEIVTTDTIFLNQVTDNGTSVEALITIGDVNLPIPKTKTVILWQGDEYVKIDQWTDDDVRSRLNELL